VRRIRRGKGMLVVEGDPDCRSAGSFFKNPVVSAEQAAQIAAVVGKQPPCFPAGPGQVKLPAAWLIEQAGFAKGYVRGRAAISSRHTLALVNSAERRRRRCWRWPARSPRPWKRASAFNLRWSPVLAGF